MKIAVMGDLHIGCNDYSEKRASDFSHKFNEAIDLALKQKVQAILLLGDVFDSSAYRRSIDSFALYLHEIAPGLVKAREMDVPILAIMGNHEFGRGREGGELNILADLGFVHLLKDSMFELEGNKFFGISWKNSTEEFLQVLQKFKPDNKSFLLMHQFVSGAAAIPKDLWEIDNVSLKSWSKVFVGHHHIHESFGNICIPGSLEVHNVLELTSKKPKGFIIYDTDSGKEDFIEMTIGRPIKYLDFEVSSKTRILAEKEINDWILKNSEANALLIIKLSGRLAYGRSSEINLRESRSIGIRNGCLAVSFINNINDPIRSAPQIKASMNLDAFLKRWFKSDSSKAIEYFDELKEFGDDFAPRLRQKIIGALK
ncbi:MAG: metallophosphoesterase [Candidatus Parvarchaeum sp.]